MFFFIVFLVCDQGDCLSISASSLAAMAMCVLMLNELQGCGWWLDRAGRNVQEGGEMVAQGCCALANSVLQRTKSRFRTVILTWCWQTSSLTARSVSETFASDTTFVHLKNFSNTIIVSKQNVVDIIFLNLQKRFGVHVFAESWLTCGSRQGGARAWQIALACALSDIPAWSLWKCP